MNDKVLKESDVLKTIAVLSVILQGVLAFLQVQFVSEQDFSAALWLMQVIKYSAPMFIFAICFDVVATQRLDIKTYWQHKFWELVVPFLLWSGIYLFLFQPWSSQSLASNLQTIFTGSSAPHLWYTVMMLQFQILIPFLVVLATWSQGKWQRITLLLLGSVIVFSIYREWGTQVEFIYRDLLFLGYGLFAVLAIVLSRQRQMLQFFWQLRHWITGMFILLISLSAYQILQQPVQGIVLSQIDYYQDFMMFYNIIMIVIGLNLAVWLKQKQRLVNRFCKWIATYAFRAYLANFFFLQLAGGVLRPALAPLPIGVQGVILFLLTAALAFSFVYGLEQLNRKIRQSSLLY